MEERLDKLLLSRGLVSSRVRAERMIREVGVKVNGKLINKTGKKFPIDCTIEIIEEDDPIPGPSEVRVRSTVMTINPADLLSIEGRYGATPINLPATPGVGAYGIVDAVGKDVTRLEIGDAVLPIGTGFWADTLILHERMAPKAPIGIDPEQTALMRANPSTAYLLLTDIVDLQPGDWAALLFSRGSDDNGFGHSRGYPV